AAFAAGAAARTGTVDALAAALPHDSWAPAEQVSFSSRWKWSAVRGDDCWSVLGAPEVLLAGPVEEAAVHEQAGRRVLAFGTATRVDAGGDEPVLPAVEPAGLVVFEERLRDDAGATIAYMYDQGVDVKI